MLVCAPTGAGKTNIAMLAFLQHVKQQINEEEMLDMGAVKAVYIAPMKALAQVGAVAPPGNASMPVFWLTSRHTNPLSMR